MGYKMDEKEIRRKILELLYNRAREGSGSVSKGTLRKELGIDNAELNFNINYLQSEGYIRVKKAMGGYYTSEIKGKGTNLVENHEEFNNLFPTVNITHVYNSKGVVVGSTNVEINIDESFKIEDSFNEIYNEIRKQENSDEIIEKIMVIEHELNKDTVNKSKVKDSMDWLKRNANWTIPSLVQILTSVFW